MTTVVLLILAMVWAVVLGPSLLRRRAERRATDSIGAFHRQLRVLQRTGPSMVDAAHRLGTELPESGSPFRVAGARGGILVVRPDAPGSMPLDVRAHRRPDPYFRPEACKRRRDVLLLLLSVLVATGLLGAVPKMHALLYVTIVGAVALAGYVGLLVHLRNLALEREVKLHYLPQPTEHESTLVVRRAAVR